MSDDPKYEALKYSYEQFDKNILFIASGALGISFGFIEKIIPDITKAVYDGLLIWSWYIFAGVIFFCLLAHFISTRAISWAIAHEKDCDYDTKCNRWNLIIRTINISMIFGLVFGIVLLISFIKQNI